MNKDLETEIEKAHNEACTKGSDTYTDPQTGFAVFTKDFLLKQGYCCDNKCRHCPYEAKEK